MKILFHQQKRSAPKQELPKRSKRRKRLSFRAKAPRPPGPYRPSKLPRLRQDRGLGLFWGVILVIMLLFSLGHIWKAQQVSSLCARLDALRRQQQEQLERLKTAELTLQEASTYSKIEPLALEKLGMQPSVKPPIAIAPLDERFLAIQNTSYAARTPLQESR